MDQREDGLNMRLNNLLRNQNSTPQLVLMRPSKNIQQRLGAKTKSRRRKKRKTNKRKDYKPKRKKTLKKKRKGNKKKEEMSIFKDIF